MTGRTRQPVTGNIQNTNSGTSKLVRGRLLDYWGGTTVFTKSMLVCAALVSGMFFVNSETAEAGRRVVVRGPFGGRVYVGPRRTYVRGPLGGTYYSGPRATYYAPPRYGYNYGYYPYNYGRGYSTGYYYAPSTGYYYYR